MKNRVGAGKDWRLKAKINKIIFTAFISGAPSCHKFDKACFFHTKEREIEKFIFPANMKLIKYSL